MLISVFCFFFNLLKHFASLPLMVQKILRDKNESHQKKLQNIKLKNLLSLQFYPI